MIDKLKYEEWENQQIRRRLQQQNKSASGKIMTTVFVPEGLPLCAGVLQFQENADGFKMRYLQLWHKVCLLLCSSQNGKGTEIVHYGKEAPSEKQIRREAKIKLSVDLSKIETLDKTALKSKTGEIAGYSLVLKGPAGAFMLASEIENTIQEWYKHLRSVIKGRQVSRTGSDKDRATTRHHGATERSFRF